MNPKRVISTAVLFLLLGTTIPAFAQKGEEEKGGGKAQPAQHQAQPQHAQKAESQHAQKAQPQHAQKAESQHAQKAQPQHAQRAESQHAQKAQPQHAQRAESQHAQKAESQHAQRAESQHAQRAESQRGQRAESQRGQAVANNRGNNGGHYGRISEANYREHFGRGHSFHMMRPQMMGGYNRFHYGGYWFGFNVGWPYGWSYNDDCYVVYEGGAYYLYNLRHPGIHITLILF